MTATPSRFDAVSHVLLAARGMRLQLGEFARSSALRCAAALLEGVARSAQEMTSDSELVSPADVVRAAAARRLQDVIISSSRQEALLDESFCIPGCRHLYQILLMPDRELQIAGWRKEAWLARQPAEVDEGPEFSDS